MSAVGRASPGPQAGIWPLGLGTARLSVLPRRVAAALRRDGSPTPAPSPPHLWHSPCRCSPLYRCSCGTRCWPGSSRGLHRGWRSRGHSLWGEAAVSARLAGRLPRALDAGPGLVPCWCVCGMQVGSPRSLLGEQIWGTLSGGGAGLVRGPTERPGRPTPSQAKVTTPGRQLRTPALPQPMSARAGAQPWASKPGPTGPPAPVRYSGHKLSTPHTSLGQLLCPAVGLEPRTCPPCTSEWCRSGPA